MSSATGIGLALHLFIAQDAAPRFVDVALPVLERLDETPDRRFATPRLGAGGLAVADVDGDGKPDLYAGRAAGLPNRLLLTRADGKFVDAAPQYGLDVLDATCGALFTDLDGDGRDDALLFGDALHSLRRVGERFEADAALGIAVPPGFDGVCTAVAAADVDGDGDRDLFVATSRAMSGRLADALPFPLFDATNGPRHLFFRNDGGRFVAALEAAGLAAGATRLASDARFLDVDGDGDQDLVVANDPGLAQLYVNDGKGRFTEVALCDGRDLVGSARFVAFEDFDGAAGGARELWIAAPSDPAGEERFANAPRGSTPLDAFAERVRRDALSTVAGGFALACGAGGRKEIGATLGLAHLGPFSCGVVADFSGDGSPEIALFGGARDDRAKFWAEVVPVHGRLGADPGKAAEALDALPPDPAPPPEPRLLARAADGAFHPIPAALPDLPALRDPAAVVTWDFDGDGARDLALLDARDSALVVLRNVTREPAVKAPEPPPPVGGGPRWVRTAVPTPAPSVELPTARGGRVRFDAKRERPCLVVLGEPTAAAAEAAAVTDADVVLLGAPPEREVVTRARAVFERVSKVVTGDRFAALRFRVDRDGWIDLVAADVPLADLLAAPPAAPGRWLGERRRGVADLPRAVLAARLPNLALAAWQRLEAAGVTGFDFDVGLTLLETRRSADAEPRFAAVPPSSPDYPRAQLELARLLEKGQRDADARAAYARAVAAAPTDGVARFEQGRLLLRARDDESEAVGTEALRFATYFKPEWPDAHFAFGQALVRVNRLDEAAGAFERTASIDGQNPAARAQALFELAAVLHRLHRDREALEQAQRAHDLDPESASIGKLLDALRSKKGD